MNSSIKKFLKFNISKPKYLSALGHYNTPKYLDYLIDKEDKDLNGVDYRVLFNTYELSGTFSETVYYLPLSVIYLCKDIDDRLEMVEDFIDYIFVNKIDIEKLFSIEISEIINCIVDCNIESYSKIYLDKNEYCKEKNKAGKTFNIKNFWFVDEVFKNVNKFEAGRKWIKAKIEEMKNGTVTQKKWLYTLYEECNEVFGLYLDDEMMR